MIIRYEELDKVRRGNEKIALCTGCFDLFHAGHLFFFEEVKKNCDVLVVAVLSDLKIKKKKGSKRPIIDANNRVKLLDSLKIVDYVILVDFESDLSDYKKYDIISEETFFWSCYGEILSVLRPNILGVSPHHRISMAMECFFKDIGTEVFEVDLSDNLSTTNIISKIWELR